MLDLLARLEKSILGIVLSAKRVSVYAIADLARQSEERRSELVGGSASSSVSDFASNSCGVSLT